MAEDTKSVMVFYTDLIIRQGNNDRLPSTVQMYGILVIKIDYML